MRSCVIPVIVDKLSGSVRVTLWTRLRLISPYTGEPTEAQGQDRLSRRGQQTGFDQPRIFFLLSGFSFDFLVILCYMYFVCKPSITRVYTCVIDLHANKINLWGQPPNSSKAQFKKHTHVLELLKYSFFLRLFLFCSMLIIFLKDFTGNSFLLEENQQILTYLHTISFQLSLWCCCIITPKCVSSYLIASHAKVLEMFICCFLQSHAYVNALYL